MRAIRLAAAVVCVAVLTAAGQVQAGVINSADVTIGGTPFRTFTDSSTGLNWLDLDNFWVNGSSYNSITALLSGSGFHLATLTDLLGLQASIPVVPANFHSEAVIVGGDYVGKLSPSLNRDILWGIYEDGNPANLVSYSWKSGGNPTWLFAPNVVQATAIIGTDLGAWVVADSVAVASPVPEPSTFALLGIGAVCLIGYGRRRKRKAA